VSHFVLVTFPATSSHPLSLYIPRRYHFAPFLFVQQRQYIPVQIPDFDKEQGQAQPALCEYFELGDNAENIMFL